MNRNETKNIDNELIVLTIIALVPRVIKNARPNKMNCGLTAVALTRNIDARKIRCLKKFRAKKKMNGSAKATLFPLSNVIITG